MEQRDSNMQSESAQPGWRALWPSCRYASRLQSRALDESLPLAQRFGLRLHLLLCKWCRRYGRQIRFLRQAARRQASGEVLETSRPGLSPEARNRIRQAIAEKRRDDSSSSPSATE